MVDALPDLTPVMLSGLTWDEAKSALQHVDCAVRRPHWCSPVVILGQDGEPIMDSDGDLYALELDRYDRHARDWSMTPRADDNGDEVPPTYRTAAQAGTEK